MHSRFVEISFLLCLNKQLQSSKYFPEMSEFQAKILSYFWPFAFSQLTQLGGGFYPLALFDLTRAKKKAYQRCYVPTGHFLLSLL